MAAAPVNFYYRWQLPDHMLKREIALGSALFKYVGEVVNHVVSEKASESQVEAFYDGLNLSYDADWRDVGTATTALNAMVSPRAGPLAAHVRTQLGLDDVKDFHRLAKHLNYLKRVRGHDAEELPIGHFDQLLVRLIDSMKVTGFEDRLGALRLEAASDAVRSSTNVFTKFDRLDWQQGSVLITACVVDARSEGLLRWNWRLVIDVSDRQDQAKRFPWFEHHHPDAPPQCRPRRSYVSVDCHKSSVEVGGMRNAVEKLMREQKRINAVVLIGDAVLTPIKKKFIRALLASDAVMIDSRLVVFDARSASTSITEPSDVEEDCVQASNLVLSWTMEACIARHKHYYFSSKFSELLTQNHRDVSAMGMEIVEGMRPHPDETRLNKLRYDLLSMNGPADWTLLQHDSSLPLREIDKVIWDKLLPLISEKGIGVRSLYL